MKRKPPPARQRGDLDGGAASARAREERDARVDRVISLMSKGQWYGVRSQRALAAELGCSPETVKDYAREASGFLVRLNAMGPEEREAMRAQHLADLERNRREAMRWAKVDVKGLSAANQALDLRAKVLGLNAPTQVELAADLAGLTDDEVEQRLVAALESLRAKRGATE